MCPFHSFSFGRDGQCNHVPNTTPPKKAKLKSWPVQEVYGLIMAFHDAYRTPEAPIETRHLELYKGYVNEFKEEHASIVTEKMIEETTLTGTAEEIKARIRALEAAGVNQVAIHGGSRERTRAVIEEFAATVIN